MLKKFFEIIIFIAGFSCLAWLGNWQLERAEWKRDIIVKLDREYNKDASAYEFQADDFSNENDESFKVVRGHISGTFLQDKTLLWPTLMDGGYGFVLMDPLILPDGNIIMVNRGWVPEKVGERVPAKFIPPASETDIKVTGLVRAMEANRFTLENDLLNNRWHRFKPSQISKYLDVNYVYPFVLFAEDIQGSKSKTLGRLGYKNPYPRNKHSQYAAFWLTLSGVWFLIIGTIIFKRNYNY